ncbi:glycosyltransferase family A protein [Halovibrio sp. HP20-50]|uniref:glycosyltransferase family A protein n=1 Tax=Halovibrio sp. HP20-59 TaxID=3080275 RepID=UPI00294B5085|nr:glycosyltransferase family A protein [Halovibrio sp. HP20-59]MEA2120516.1 glycosyltransferase family A protein [Halovibrio sp. HP20-59]
MFTVIIPVHNKKEHVVAAIESVLAQTNDKFELILIDDCSIDGSSELILPYESDKIKIYKRDSPGPGGYAARNLGVEKAKYQWITFLDADDVWYSNHLETSEQLISKYEEVRFFSLSRNKVFKGKKSGFDHSKEEQIDRDVALVRFASKDIFHTNAVVIDKDLFIETGGFPAGQCKRGGDSDLWLRLLLSCSSIVVSPVITSCYALDNSGVIYGKSKVEKQHPVQKTVMRFIEKNPDKEINTSLKRLSNRKNFSWLAARKRSGDLTFSDLNIIYFSCLDKSGFKQLLKFMVPLPVSNFSATFKKRSL